MADINLRPAKRIYERILRARPKHADIENVPRQNSFSMVGHKTAPIGKERGSPVPGCDYVAKVEQK
jgi:predicted TPR repeat methyltransferase